MDDPGSTRGMALRRKRERLGMGKQRRIGSTMEVAMLVTRPTLARLVRVVIPGIACRHIVDVVGRIVASRLGESPGEATHWTGRVTAKVAGIRLTSVQRFRKAHGLAPDRIRTF